MTQLIVQGRFDQSKNQLIINFGNLSQQSNNQGSWISPVLQQPTFIQKHSLRFGSSALGLAGSIGLVVSCVWSVLLPAIGSIGVIGIACLLRRKIVSLNSNELPSATDKVHNLFQSRAANSEEDLLGNIGFDDKLPPPMTPTDINDSDQEFDDDPEIDDNPELDIVNPQDNFLTQFQSYIVQNNVLNCESLRAAFSTSGYETYFLPKQLLEELLSAYQSIQSDDSKRIKNKDSNSLGTYVQGKIKFIERELGENFYQEQNPTQEQKDFIQVIHEQSEKEQWNAVDSSDKYKFLDKKMNLIGTLYEALGRCATLDESTRKHFAEKASSAYAHALYFRNKT